MINIRKMILQRGSLFFYFLVVGIIMGAEHGVSWIIDYHSIVDPHVTCYGKSISSGSANVAKLNLICGGRKAHSESYKDVAQYASTPNLPIYCELRRSGSITCSD